MTCESVKELADLYLYGELAGEEKIGHLFDRLTSHTKSPIADRIFCVARKRQFLAASSVVPSISPMFRKRNP